ncbi:MAG: PilZ domain-containing protein [Candidatus Sulfobium sp.]
MEKRKVSRNGILANFQFYIDDKSKETFEGITINISPRGFGFLTETVVQEGQTITIKKHVLPDYKDRKAKVTWVKKVSRYISAGAQFD